jgi:hypothetical protein
MDRCPSVILPMGVTAASLLVVTTGKVARLVAAWG